MERWRKRGARTLAVLAGAWWLASCGFHLQGRYDLPKSLATVRIEAPDAQSGFCTALRAALLADGARLDGAPEASATIRVLDDTAAQRVLTVSAHNIPTAYVLSYRIRLAVEYQGRELMAPEEHLVTREYSFDERDFLAKERERDTLTQALADDLAALIMRRLAAL